MLPPGFKLPSFSAASIIPTAIRSFTLPPGFLDSIFAKTLASLSETSFDSFTRGRYGHPLQDRPLTPREAARIQGFPDSYVFIGTRGDIRSQIGNAVPPPLAKVIGKEILRSLLCVDGIIEDEGIDSGVPEQQRLFGT